MKTFAVALACLACLAPVADARSSPKLTTRQINAALNAAADDLGEPVDSANCHVARIRADCVLVVKRDDEPGSADGGVKPGTCLAPVTVLLRRGRVLYALDLARGPHMQGYCAAR